VGEYVGRCFVGCLFSLRFRRVGDKDIRESECEYGERVSDGSETE